MYIWRHTYNKTKSKIISYHFALLLQQDTVLVVGARSHTLRTHDALLVGGSLIPDGLPGGLDLLLGDVDAVQVEVEWI